MLDRLQYQMHYRWLIVPIIFFVADGVSTTSASTNDTSLSTGGFWVRAELTAMSWRRGCVTTALCAEPRVAIAHVRQNADERVSADWRADRTFSLTAPLVTRSFWSNGLPADVSTQVSVTGVDPIFHFARLCDETPHVRVAPSGRSWDDEPTSTVVELRANCFNATLHVRVFRAADCSGDLSTDANADNGTNGQQSASLLVWPIGRLTTDSFIIIFSALTAFNVLTLFFTLFYCTHTGLRRGEKASSSTTGSASTFLPYDGQMVTARTSYTQSELHYDTIGDISVRKSFLRFPDPEPSADERNERPAQAATPSWHRHSQSDMYRVRLPYPTAVASIRPPLVTPRRATRSMVSIGRVRLPAAQCCDECFLRGARRRADGRRPPPCACAFSPSTASSSSTFDDSGRDSVV